MATCWEILGIDPSATPEEVKKAYYRQSLGAHPDAGGSTKRFVELNIAYREALDAASQPVLCSKCQGLGFVPAFNGWISVSVHCKQCKGAGQIPR